jgi:hypothetical protein
MLQKSFVVKSFWKNEYLIEIFGFVIQTVLVLPLEDEINTSCRNYQS